MLKTVKRLALGLFLIFLASSILLVSDWNRRTSTHNHIPRVAILQHASTRVLDDCLDGMVDGLAKAGYTDGKSIIYQRYNSQGDISVSNSIAREMVNGNFDLFLTSSTISMQTLANANRGHRRYRFSARWLTPPRRASALTWRSRLLTPPT
jgi:ABC-type uncharacterized transport system substrate-binding protein